MTKAFPMTRVRTISRGCDFGLWRITSGSLSPVLGGEGWGEGPFSRRTQLDKPPLTPALSPEYRGEGANASPHRSGIPSSRLASNRVRAAPSTMDRIPHLAQHKDGARICEK